MWLVRWYAPRECPPVDCECVVPFDPCKDAIRWRDGIYGGRFIRDVLNHIEIWARKGTPSDYVRDLAARLRGHVVGRSPSLMNAYLIRLPLPATTRRDQIIRELRKDEHFTCVGPPALVGEP